MYQDGVNYYERKWPEHRTRMFATSHWGRWHEGTREFLATLPVTVVDRTTFAYDSFWELP